MSETLILNPPSAEAQSPALSPDVLSQPIQHNGVWKVGIGDPYPYAQGHPSESPIEEAPISYEDVHTAIETAYQAREQYNGVQTNGREYRESLREIVEPIDGEKGLDHLAYLTVTGQQERDALNSKSGLGKVPGLVGDELNDFWTLSGELSTVKDMVGVLPKKSRKFYHTKVKDYENKLGIVHVEHDDGGVDDASLPPSPTGDTSGNQPGKESLLRKVAHRGKELLTSRRARSLGLVALGGAGAGYLIAKGIISSEHAQILHGLQPGNSAPHIQLDADIKHLHAAHTPPPTYTENNQEVYGEDKVSKGELVAFNLGSASLAARGIHRFRKRRHELAEHRQHNKHEREHEEAQRIALETLLNPYSLDSNQLVDAMKHPLVLNEIASRGGGPSGSAYSSDILIRYARLVAPHVGGNAEAVKKHFKSLHIELGDTEISDALTPNGRATINIFNPHADEVAKIAEELTAGHLHFGDLPPARSFLRDKVIIDAIDRIKPLVAIAGPGLLDRARNANEHPYTLSGGPTVHVLNYQILNSVRTITYRLSALLPSDAARKAAIQALQLEDYIDEYVPKRARLTSRQVPVIDPATRQPVGLQFVPVKEEYPAPPGSPTRYRLHPRGAKPITLAAKLVAWERAAYTS